ncbi:MAG: F0F1 ATP synthase subunit epsilon [Gemmataceae bacterium]
MAEKKLNCVVVTPERAVLNVSADYVSVPLVDGELGVLPGRAALLGRLGYGELRVRQGTQTQNLYLEGGLVQIRDNIVTLLTPRALTTEEIKPEVLIEQLEAAKSTDGSSGVASSLSITDRQKARAQLRIARKKKS